MGLKSTLVPSHHALCWGTHFISLEGRRRILHTKAVARTSASGALITHDRDILLFSFPRLRNRDTRRLRYFLKITQLAGGGVGTQTRNLTGSLVSSPGYCRLFLSHECSASGH